MIQSCISHAGLDEIRGCPQKSPKSLFRTVFLIEKLRESSRLTELAKQISKTQPKIFEITPREGVCRRLESDMQK